MVGRYVQSGGDGWAAEYEKAEFETPSDGACYFRLWDQEDLARRITEELPRRADVQDEVFEIARPCSVGQSFRSTRGVSNWKE